MPSTACRLRCAFGWRTEGFPCPRPADSSGCGVAHGASSGRLGIGRAVSPLRLGESVATFHRLMHVLHRLPPPLRIRVED